MSKSQGFLIFFMSTFSHFPNSPSLKQDYTLATGDSVVRFSCVAINLARTDTILSTETPIDSAIIGLTAMVYVNESAWVCFFVFFILFFCFFCF